jgi:hypothetical protein
MHTLYFQGVALSSQYGIGSMHSFHPEALVLNAPVLFLQTSYNEFINLKISNHVYVKLSPIYVSCFCRNNRIIAYFNSISKANLQRQEKHKIDSTTTCSRILEESQQLLLCCCLFKKKIMMMPEHRDDWIL